MTVIPHFAFPIKLDSNGHFSTVEQDSVEDILSCVYVALKTPVGTRPYVPDFGVDDFTFSSPVQGFSELLAQIQSSEPRASIDLQDQIENMVETIQVGVANVG